MPDTRQMTCIICPVGCRLTVISEGQEVISATGNICRRGEAYAQRELADPKRMLTTTIRLKNGIIPMAPVKTDKPVQRSRLAECMRLINTMKANAPVRSGDVVIWNIAGTGSNIVITRNIPEREEK